MNGDGAGMPLWRALGLVLVVSSGGTVGFNLLFDHRPDPYTGKEADQMRRELLLEMRELESRIRVDMPPPETRSRIEALEAKERERDPTWRPPEYRWSRTE